MHEKSKKICMKCGSENLKITVTPWKVAWGQFFADQYKCMDCGSEGIAIEASEKQAEKIREKLKNRSNNKK